MKILVIDNSKRFVDELQTNLLVDMPVKFTLEWTNVFNTAGDYDIYIVNTKLTGNRKNGLKYIKNLRETQPEAMIFVLTTHSDFQHLNAAINSKIDGFIDSESRSILQIVKSYKLQCLREKIKKLYEKTNELCLSLQSA